MLIVGILMLVIGIGFLYKNSKLKKFYKIIQKGKLKDYKKTIGIVICDAFDISDANETPLNKPVTPIIEYEVNGQKYETQNRILITGAELPVGTKLYVWYNKNHPQIAVPSTDFESTILEKLVSVFLILFGILFIITNI